MSLLLVQQPGKMHVIDSVQNYGHWPKACVLARTSCNVGHECMRQVRCKWRSAGWRGWCVQHIT